MTEVQPVLVVEDEILIRMDLVDVIQSAGFSVHESASGSAAVNEIDRLDVLHALVTDINLGSPPDGWSVARHGREKFPSLAVVYITGDSADDWSSKGVPNSSVLQKPFADAQLISVLTAQLSAAGPQPNSPA